MNLTKKIPLLILCFISVSAFGQQYQLNNENVIFSFKTKNNKRLTVCIDKNNKYLVYRFGSEKKVALEFPEKKDSSSFEKFEYSYYMRPGGVSNDGLDLNYLTFSIDKYNYIVYDNYAAVGEDTEIGVRIIDTTTNIQKEIRGINKTKKGTLIDFRFEDWVKIGNKTYD